MSISSFLNIPVCHYSFRVILISVTDVIGLEDTTEKINDANQQHMEEIVPPKSMTFNLFFSCIIACISYTISFTEKLILFAN